MLALAPSNALLEHVQVVPLVWKAGRRWLDRRAARRRFLRAMRRLE